MTTTYVSTIDAKEEFSQLLNRVTHHHERIILTRRGIQIAAIVPLEDFQLLQKSQSKTDLDEAVEALKEARKEGSVTLDDFKTEIG